MKRIGNEEGSALVEFAFSCMILLMLLFGIIDFSFAFYAYNFTAEAAKEAARYASVRGGNSCAGTPQLSDCNVSSDQVQTAVQHMGYPGINPDNTRVAVTWPDGDNNPGHNVKVDVTYTFPLSVPFWNATQLDLHSTAEMVVSN